MSINDSLPPGYDEWRTRSDRDERPDPGVDPDDHAMVKAELADALTALRALIAAVEALRDVVDHINATIDIHQGDK